MMTYEENLNAAKHLGYTDAACMACANLSTPDSNTCKKCISETPAFTEAVAEFMLTAVLCGFLTKNGEVNEPEHRTPDEPLRC